MSRILSRRDRWAERAARALETGNLKDIGRALGALRQLDDKRTDREDDLHARLNHWLETETYATMGVRVHLG